MWIVLFALCSDGYEGRRGNRAWSSSDADMDIGLEFARFSAFDPGAHQVKTQPDREGGAGKTH